MFPESDELQHSFVCRTCPYEFIVDKGYYSRRMSRVRKVDDIMGGAAAWANVDQTTGMHPLWTCDEV
jgi:DNA-directed RNA polymerase III subunit RPC11